MHYHNVQQRHTLNHCLLSAQQRWREMNLCTKVLKLIACHQKKACVCPHRWHSSITDDRSCKHLRLLQSFDLETFDKGRMLEGLKDMKVTSPHQQFKNPEPFFSLCHQVNRVHYQNEPHLFNDLHRRARRSTELHKDDCSFCVDQFIKHRVHFF